VAGQITDLVDYADFGAAGYESTGWASLTGNDGQPGDPTLGLDNYYARDYDTATGSWVQPDQWRGMLVRPQSLNRYAYIENTPVSFSDDLGYAIKAVPMVDGGTTFAKRLARSVFTRATHSLGAGLPSAPGAKRGGSPAKRFPKASITTPGKRSDSLVSQLHRFVNSGCSTSDAMCRGIRPVGTMASRNGCFGMANPAACLLGEMDHSVRSDMRPILDGIGAGVGWVGGQLAVATRGIVNAPATFVGMMYASSTGGVCALMVDGRVVCGRAPGGGTGLSGTAWGAQNGAAVTIGNVTYGGFDVDKLLTNKDLLRHETNHTWQWALGGGGVGFVLPWAIMGGTSPCNPIEQAAGLKGTGYEGREVECR
jgi:RHS repeat-associated protein